MNFPFVLLGGMFDQRRLHLRRDSKEIDVQWDIVNLLFCWRFPY